MKKKTMVLGASLKPERISNLVLHRLSAKNQEVVAFGLRSGTVANVSISDSLKHHQDIHTVTLYLNPERQKNYYDYVLSLNPERVIFNPGTENPEFYGVLEDNGIEYEVACTLVLLATDQY